MNARRMGCCLHLHGGMGAEEIVFTGRPSAAWIRANMCIHLKRIEERLSIYLPMWRGNAGACGTSKANL